VVFGIIRTGVPWRELLTDFGGRGNTHLILSVVLTKASGKFFEMLIDDLV
jgi:hypothetical protein